MKFCRAFAFRVRIAVAEFRIIPEDESHAITAKFNNMNFTKILGLLQCILSLWLILADIVAFADVEDL